MKILTAIYPLHCASDVRQTILDDLSRSVVSERKKQKGSKPQWIQTVGKDRVVLTVIIGN